MSDFIESLPTDNGPVRSDEEEILGEILKNDKTSFQKFIGDLKDPILGGVLFIVLNIPFVKQLISDFVPYAKSSEMSSLVFRLVLFVVLFFLIQNINLIQKS